MNRLSMRIYGYDKDDLPGTLNTLKRYGFSGVVGHDGGEAARYFTQNGIGYFVVRKCFLLDDNTGLTKNLCVDIKGNRVKWFGSACPVNPDVMERSLSEARLMAGTPNISGVIVDGGRFASPASGAGAGPEDLDVFFTCFCDYCREKMAELNFSHDEIKTSLDALYTHCQTGRGFDLSIHGAGIESWLSFRKAVITRHMSRWAAAVREVNPSLKVGMYIFSPSLSRLVGQSYAELSEIFDFLSPMIYRYYNEAVGTACLDHEIAAILRLAEGLDSPHKKPVLELYEGLTGLPFQSSLPTISGLKRNGCPPSYVTAEVKKAKSLTGGRTEVIPIFILKDRYAKEALKDCADNGIGAVDFFNYNKDAIEELLN